MLDNGAKADYQTTDTFLTPLHWAAYNKDAGCIQELLKRGAAHDSFSAMGRLPIDLAGSSRAYEVIDVCLTNYYERIRALDPSIGGPSRTEEQIELEDKADFGSENIPYQPRD